MSIKGLKISDFEAPYRQPTQVRGAAKFDSILDAANALIESEGYGRFSLGDVAQHAGVAKGSVYHFFPNMEALYVALVERYDQAFIDIVDAPINAGDVSSWEDVVEIHFDRSRDFITENPSALILIIGPGRTWETRLKDAAGDIRLAKHMRDALNRFFVIPATPPPEQLLRMAIQILNGLWELSVVEHGFVHDYYATETKIAACAYLRQYWPPKLERQPPRGR